MATLELYARGDSSTANNASLNAQGTSTTPTTLLTFSDDTNQDGTADGDLNWDIFISGASDPDTVVYVGTDPIAYTYTVEFGGTLPNTNKLSNVNGVDLRGQEILVITISNGQRLFFLTDPALNSDFLLMDAFPNGAHNIQGVFVCYAEGTLIDTPGGPRAVETLAEGDLITGTGGAPVTIRYFAKRHFPASQIAAFPMLQPVTIPVGYIAPGAPSRPLTVSALHRILVRDADLERLFGLDAAYVAARDLPGLSPAPARDLTYVHFLCDTHQCVTANGCESESLFPGDMALTALGTDIAETIQKRFGDTPQRTAYPCLTGKEAAVWRASVEARMKRSA